MERFACIAQAFLKRGSLFLHPCFLTRNWLFFHKEGVLRVTLSHFAIKIFNLIQGIIACIFFFFYLFTCPVWVTFKVCRAQILSAIGPIGSKKKAKHLIIFNLSITVLPHFIQTLHPRCGNRGIAQYWAPTHMPHPHYALLSEETQMGELRPCRVPASQKYLGTFLGNCFGMQYELGVFALDKSGVFKLNLIEITCVTYRGHTLIPVTIARWETSGCVCVFFFFLLAVFPDRPLCSHHWRRLGLRHVAG